MIQRIEGQIGYDRIKNSHPNGLKSKEIKRNPIHIWQASLFCLFEAVFLLTLSPLLAYRFGIAGTMLTELVLLVLSLFIVKICRADFQAVFPIRRVKLLGLIGIILIFAGAICMEAVINSVMMLAFPNEFLESGQQTAALLHSAHPLVLFFAICIMPAVCEEAMYRGVVQSAFRTWTNDIWVQSVCTGFLFGIAHLSFVQLPTLAMLGIILSFLLARYGNILYAMLFHILNNAFALVVSGAASGRFAQSLSAVRHSAEFPDPVFRLGITFLIFGTVAPFLIYTGNYLMHLAHDPVRYGYFPKKHRAAILRTLIITSGSCFFSGFCILLFL